MVEINTARQGPLAHLSTDEIVGLMNRIRRAAIAASVDRDGREYDAYAQVLTQLNNLHILRTGKPY